MKTVMENSIIDGFGKNVKNTDVEEMRSLVKENNITNAFRDMNNIFGDTAEKIHIDARHINGDNLYKIDVQRKSGDNMTIGQAFISEAVKLEIDSTGGNDILHGLYVNVVNALKRSMNEIIKTQTNDTAGTCHKYVIRTNDGR